MARALKQKVLGLVTQPCEVIGGTKGHPNPFPGTSGPWRGVSIEVPIFPNLTPDKLDIKDSVIFEKAKPDNKITVATLISKLGGTHNLYVAGWASQDYAISERLGWETGKGYPGGEEPTKHEIYGPPRLARQAHFMEVEVDTDTGQVFITKLVTVNDVGKVVNPGTVAGQQYGGAYMGVGAGMYDEMFYDPITGVLLNDNYIGYATPLMLDFGHSGTIETIALETGLGYGPYGTVGIAESLGTIGAALPITAVNNAIGKWVDDIPITPDKVLKALGKA
jgi:xanthine dehydrogenase molybdenum-binding subunit